MEAQRCKNLSILSKKKKKNDKNTVFQNEILYKLVSGSISHLRGAGPATVTGEHD